MPTKKGTKSPKKQVELPVVDFAKYHHLLSAVSTYSIKGKVTELTGIVVRAVMPGVRIGELCFIVPYHNRPPIKAEVVGSAGRTRADDADVIVGCAEALRADTGWQPRIPWEQTVTDLLDDWRGRVAYL